MGKRSKRARTILRRMSMLGEIPSLDMARRYGIEREVQAQIDIKRAAEAEAARIIEEQELLRQQQLEAKLKAEEEEKKKLEATSKPKQTTRKRPIQVGNPP